jgi:trans-aconitate 2-methyltransferase
MPMAWSAEQYVKFEDERTRAARDLLAQVPELPEGEVYDLGCGPGNSTELLVGRFPGHTVAGVDSDADMLDAARKRLPEQRFHQGDLTDWTPPEPAVLLFANAVFQWVPDHVAVLSRLMDHLKPGGVLAIQMPDNRGERCRGRSAISTRFRRKRRRSTSGTPSTTIRWPTPPRSSNG